MPGLISAALRCVSSKESNAQFIRHVRDQSLSLQSSSTAELRNFSTQLRQKASIRPFEQTSVLTSAFALANASLQRTLGIQLYDVQLIAARTLAAGEIAEMQTGEGKTFSAVPAAVWGGLIGHGVHVSTPNHYLAMRDYSELKPVYEMAGISVGLLPERTTSCAKRKAYACDVTYGSGYEFGFDYLRDQLALRSLAKQELGESLLRSLERRPASPQQVTCQRGLWFAIVDEADNVLVDDATSPLILSESQPGDACDADAVRLARYVATHLDERHIKQLGPQQLELSDLGRERIHGDDIAIPVHQLLRPWTSYVVTALRADRFFRRDVHYVVDRETVQIVDASTGRVFADRAWQSGLHQAIEAKENLRITPEKSALARITRQRFYRLYDRVAGMTGTAASCRRELQSVYGVKTRIIPLRTPSQRTLLPMRCFTTQAAKWQAIVRSIREYHVTGRPLLIGTRTIAESDQLANLLTGHDTPFQVLNDRQDEEEAQIIARAGRAGKITIATNLAGRGTDIKLSEKVKELGGLHVIVTEPHESPRIDRQMIGRAGRQGDPGSAQLFVAMDDWLIKTFGSWLTASTAQLVDGSGEITLRLEPQIRRIQLAAERQHYAVRAQMLRADLANDDLFG